MKLKYINQIQANISITSHMKTSNILDGTYKSVYRGKSMNFENLREYVINDDVKDIDWKASSRSGTILVKQFIAEKKHNIMLVMDTGKKMDADTSSNFQKKEIALMTAGTIGYIAVKNGDYIGMMYNANNKINYKPLKYSLYNLEEYLTEYERNATLETDTNLDETLKYIIKNIKKKMILFIVTDLEGLNNISTKTIKALKEAHDVLLINIEDAFMTGENIYDIDEDNYIPPILLQDKQLNEIEKEIRKNILSKNKRRLKNNKIEMVTIKDKESIPMKLIELLESHKYASNN